jgi:DNA repair protein RecN (Recombination protein N)
VLLEMRVENYAVIDNAVVEFAPGLNLLSGETGAGKSILIDALALLMGEKASSDVVRHGAEKTVISAVFEGDSGRVSDVLEANGIDAENELIIRREIAAGGKGRVFVNNQPATVAVLKQLAPRLAAIHAQNESILAFDAAARLALLDSYAGVDRTPVADAFAKLRTIRERIQELQRDEQDRLRMVDLWSFQRKEIQDARLQAGEDERLESEKRVLANAEKIYASAMAAYDVLYDSSQSAAAALRTAARHVQELSRFDEKFRELLPGLESARIAAEDAGATLRDYADRIDASPERLAEVEDRLAIIERLKRKYGRSLDDVIAFGEEVARKLSELENKDEVLAQLCRELTAAATAYLAAARTVSKQRYEAARKLERQVESEINDLAMKARFKVEVSGSDSGEISSAAQAEDTWTAHGFDSVSYLISANPGEPLGPVEQIASGGELSRVMLALKATVEARKNSGDRSSSHAGGSRNRNRIQRTLVFDEIDTGIGGRAAEAVGKKLKALARTSQVLCVTHLPQIASFADQHFLIEKRESGGRSKTSVRLLKPEQRREELARMISGAKVTPESLKYAEQMLKAAASV